MTMSETAPLANAGATSDSVSVPVPSAAVPPATNTPATPEAAKPDPASAQETANDEGKKDEQPRGDDGKFKPKATAEERKERIREDIGRLTAEKHAAAREVERLRTEAQRLATQLREQAAKDDPLDPAAATRRAVKEERLEQINDSLQQAARETVDKRAETFERKLEDARERIPDLDQALADFMRLPVSEAAGDLIAESDKAAEIAYFLARNPSEAHRIARLPVHKQGSEIARIEARLSAAPTARKASNAPPPTPIINGSSSPTTKTPAEMSVEEMGRLLGYGR